MKPAVARWLSAAVVGIVLSCGVRAEWTMTETRDSMTDAVTQSPCITNAEGYGFCLLKRGDSELWALVSVPAAARRAALLTKFLQYRTDKRGAHLVLRPDKGAGYVAFRVASTPINLPVEVAEILAAKEIRVRLTSSIGETVEPVFQTTPAPTLVGRWLGVNATEDEIARRLRQADTEAATREADRDFERSASGRCSANAVREDFSTCMERFRSCLENAPADRATCLPPDPSAV